MLSRVHGLSAVAGNLPQGFGRFTCAESAFLTFFKIQVEEHVEIEEHNACLDKKIERPGEARQCVSRNSNIAECW